MPWCDECAKFWNPPSLEDGRCPTCGAELARPAAAPGSREAERGRAPWHFKLLLVATVVYLGYRLVQGIVWVTHHV